MPWRKNAPTLHPSPPHTGGATHQHIFRQGQEARRLPLSSAIGSLSGPELACLEATQKVLFSLGEEGRKRRDGHKGQAPLGTCYSWEFVPFSGEVAAEAGRLASLPGTRYLAGRPRQTHARHLRSGLHVVPEESGRYRATLGCAKDGYSLHGLL